MIRHLLLPHRHIALAFGILAFAALPAVAWGQDRAIEDRLDRLEHDLNLLQRQVYQGGPMVAPSGSGTEAGIEIRMDRLEQQMRDLTGQVQEYANQVQQLRQRVEQINSDIAMRFSQLGDGGGAAVGATASAASGPPAAPPAEADPRDATGATLSPPAGLMPPGTPVPQPIYGTLRPPGPDGHPRELASVGGAAAAPPHAARPPHPSSSSQYDYAFGLLERADYAGAEQAMRAFLRQHPHDPMASNAQYWIGESLFARGRYAEAATAFAEGYKRYPKSAKAPDDLLKLGMALARAGQKDNACVAFGQLRRQFPRAGGAVKERAAMERKRLRCGAG